MSNITLKNWFTTMRTSNSYAPPETAQFCFGGNVYGHPDYEDGEFVIVPPKGAAQLIKGETIFAGKTGEQYVLGNPLGECQ
jgi:hypothetical protein